MNGEMLTEIAIFIITCAVTLMGFLLKVLHEKNEKIEDALNDHKVIVARDYMQRVELVAITQAIDKRMDKMENWIGRRFDMLMGIKPQLKDDDT